MRAKSSKEAKIVIFNYEIEKKITLKPHIRGVLLLLKILNKYMLNKLKLLLPIKLVISQRRFLKFL